MALSDKIFEPSVVQYETQAARELIVEALQAEWRDRFKTKPPGPYGFLNFRDDDHARQVGVLLLPDKPHVHAANVLRRHLRWLPYGDVGPDSWQWRYESYETTACELDLISPTAADPRAAGVQAVKAATNSLVKAGILKRDFRAPVRNKPGGKVNHYRLTEPALCAVLVMLNWTYDDDFQTHSMDLRTFRRVWTALRYPSDDGPSLREIMAGWQKISIWEHVEARLDALAKLTGDLLPKEGKAGGEISPLEPAA